MNPAEPKDSPPDQTQRADSPGGVPETSAGATQSADPSSAPVRSPGKTTPRVKVELDEASEREIEAALAEISEQDLLTPSPASRLGPRLNRDNENAGDAPRRGRVLSVRRDFVFIELGGKSEGIISMLQFPDGPPAVGSAIDVLFDHYDAAEGLIVLRRPGAAQEADWSNIQEGMIVEGRVTAANKGGLVVDLSGIRAFLPAGQVDLVHVPDLESLVGQTLRCQVTEVKRSERNVVLSRRAILEAEREAAREKTWTELAEGQIRTGTVRTVKDFGAFVDLGGVDGLLPVREMSWTRVEDPNEIVRPGQQIQVQVLKIDRETRKITLGLRQLKESPWETVEQKFPLGTTVAGKVTRLMEFGAFVELEPGIEGLVHISELAHHRVRRVSDVVKEGQQLQVRVLKVDPDQRRIGLSLKATIQPDEPDEPEEPEPPGTPPAPKPVRKTPLKGGLER